MTCRLEMRSKMRETPWGYISYMEYRNKIRIQPRRDFEAIGQLLSEHRRLPGLPLAGTRTLSRSCVNSTRRASRFLPLV